MIDNMQYRLLWNRVNTATSYDIYIAYTPGAEYTKIDTVTQDPLSPVQQYLFSQVYAPENFTASQNSEGVELAWTEPLRGVPYTFKVVPNSGQVPPSDTPWLTHELPSGAVWVEQVTHSNKVLYSTHSFEVIEGITFRLADASPVMQPARIIVYVYIDIATRPDCIWIEFQSDGSWEHRMYWGRDICPYGTSGTESRRKGGSIPSCNCWFPLIIDPRDINLSSITGMSAGILSDSGESRILIDSVFFSSTPVHRLEQPHIGIKSYDIYRDGNFIGSTCSNTFIDTGATDHTISTCVDQINLVPASPSSIEISWLNQGIGTTYLYELQAVYDDGDMPAEAHLSIPCTVKIPFYSVNIYYDTDRENIATGGTLLGQFKTSSCIHANLDQGTNYWYRIEIYTYKSTTTVAENSFFLMPEFPARMTITSEHKTPILVNKVIANCTTTEEHGLGMFILGVSKLGWER